jgi:hypothetical protein
MDLDNLIVATWCALAVAAGEATLSKTSRYSKIALANSRRDRHRCTTLAAKSKTEAL